VLGPWLGQPRRDLKEGRVRLIYCFRSEDQPPRRMRLKIEINSREHFTELGHARMPFGVTSRWWSGAADVTTFALEELLGTKLRALYQRRKGRDLFDLWCGLSHGGASADRIVACFERYMRESGRNVPRAVFEENRGLAVETKTTTGSLSVYDGPGWPSGDAELRLCRLGSTYRLYKRAIGAQEWTLAATFQRPDLPETLQVGPFLYAADVNADLVASFDEVQFASVSVVEDCEA